MVSLFSLQPEPSDAIPKCSALPIPLPHFGVLPYHHITINSLRDFNKTDGICVLQQTTDYKFKWIFALSKNQQYRQMQDCDWGSEGRREYFDKSCQFILILCVL